ncbi:family 20 glycosylhydrolase, partial [Streptomyces griseolus]|uniref:family 20 glycosylhydrolase n=1 Tax=Streptomyces griseolus TaxID=1909 RepID=UPI00224341C5
RDAPDRPQRGLNLDIARKYYTPAWIEDRLREMADLKLNQLGLHFSDDQAFRIESESHPEIVSPEHLTKAEVRGILKLAASLHITVVAEIDSPGHLGAVLKAHPDLQLRNTQGTPRQGAIDISKPQAAEIVDDLLQDLTEGWLNDRAAVVREAEKIPKAWNDGFFSGGTVTADKGIEVEYWTGKEIGARPPQDYLAEGRKVVNLNDEFLYYVLGEPNNFVYPTGERIYKQWTPLVLRGTEPVPERYSKQILGGRFAVWGDFPNAQTQAQVADGIRMPLNAVSQKLWDPRKPELSWAQFKKLADEVDATS